MPDSIPAGAEISVTNSDDVGHTVTADSGDTFDESVPPGETVTFTAPEKAGEFPFHCTPHPDMTATLVVE
ncbi:cupredoxin domain-containing protein [Janibacter sp. GS2]|uniref:cupredoxin domain-containing protein n=1 Tax=Janibacter sp. GS2 TaxID=3442646 RepID=UPI003EB70CFE